MRWLACVAFLVPAIASADVSPSLVERPLDLPRTAQAWVEVGAGDHSIVGGDTWLDLGEKLAVWGPLFARVDLFRSSFQEHWFVSVETDFHLIERSWLSLAAQFRVYDRGGSRVGVAALVRLGRWGLTLDDRVLGTTGVESTSMDVNPGVIVQVTRRIAARAEVRLVHVGDAEPGFDTKTLFLLGRDGVDVAYGLVIALSRRLDLDVDVSAGREPHDRSFVFGSVSLEMHMPFPIPKPR